MKQIGELENKLNDFDPAVRARALESLTSLTQHETAPVATETDVVNMHCHTFYSFNVFGYSPSALAWLGVVIALATMGAGLPAALQDVSPACFLQVSRHSRPQK